MSVTSRATVVQSGSLASTSATPSSRSSERRRRSLPDGDGPRPDARLTVRPVRSRCPARARCPPPPRGPVGHPYPGCRPGRRRARAASSTTPWPGGGASPGRPARRAHPARTDRTGRGRRRRSGARRRRRTGVERGRTDCRDRGPSPRWGVPAGRRDGGPHTCPADRRALPGWQAHLARPGRRGRPAATATPAYPGSQRAAPHPTRSRRRRVRGRWSSPHRAAHRIATAPRAVAAPREGSRRDMRPLGPRARVPRRPPAAGRSTRRPPRRAGIGRMRACGLRQRPGQRAARPSRPWPSDGSAIRCPS